MIFMSDGYADKPRTARGQLEHEIERVKSPGPWTGVPDDRPAKLPRGRA